MHTDSDLKWQTGLPLTFGEREGRKETAIIRASVRIAVFRQHDSASECLFVSHPVKGLEVPGGAVDPDELPLDAALRELAEEAGIVIDPLKVPVQLAGFVPITDQQDGRWLDIVYVATITVGDITVGDITVGDITVGDITVGDITAEPTEAEFPITWLNVTEMEKHLSKNAQQIVGCALNYVSK